MSELYVSGNRFLTYDEMKTNAVYIRDYLGTRGWTLNAIAGMLGNMETESTINPGIWQNLNEGNTSLGYGLVQWTPATKYIEWCNENGLEPSSMESALKRIEYELDNGLQWISTEAFPMSFEEFKTSTLAAEALALVFLANYERPADSNQPARAAQAREWYQYLNTGTGGGSGGSGTVTPTQQKSLPLWLLLRAARRY